MRSLALLAFAPLLSACGKQTPPKPQAVATQSPPVEEAVVVEERRGLDWPCLAVWQSKTGDIRIAASNYGQLTTIDLPEGTSGFDPAWTLKLSGANALRKLVYSPDGLLAVCQYNEADVGIFLVDVTDVVAFVPGFADFGDAQFSADGTSLLGASEHFGDWRTFDVRLKKVLLDRQPKKGEEWKIAAKIVDGAQGRVLLFESNEGSQKPTFWDVQRDKPWPGPEAKNLQKDQTPFMAGNHLYSFGGKETVFDLATGQPLSQAALLHFREKESIPWVFWDAHRSDIKDKIYARDWIRKGKKLTLQSPSGLFRQEWAYIGPHALVNYGGTFEIYDLRTGRLAAQLALDLNPRHDWLLVLPDGTYAGTEGCDRYWKGKPALAARDNDKALTALRDVLGLRPAAKP